MMPPNQRKTDSSGWSWFNEKVLPPLIVALCIAVSGALWATYNAVQQITGTVSQHEREIQNIKAEQSAMHANLVSREELGGLLKRVELVLDNLLLRAGVKAAPVRLVPKE